MPFIRRVEYDWHLRTRSLTLGRRTAVMGILNVTPDSFSDGGHFYSPQDAPERALAQAHRMLADGADILDVGGESTRPNAAPLSSEEEQARVLPVIDAILKERPGAVLSIDTFHAATARRAIEAGVEIVNDVSGHLWDRAMSSTCASLHCGAVVMHTRGNPREWHDLPSLAPEEVVPLVTAGLRERLESAVAADELRDRIVLDPGFGFGKRGEENYPLLARLEALRQFDRPLMVGVSRKRFLAQSVARRLQVEISTGDRLHATLAANVAAILSGAHIIRVHDVRPAVEAAAVADDILLEEK
jgi:dihydropteroate synthase